MTTLRRILWTIAYPDDLRPSPAPAIIATVVGVGVGIWAVVILAL